MIATSVEQSKHLLELGMPKESADMAWYSSYAKEGYSIRMLNDTYPLDIIGEEHDEIPAWSLTVLLDFLPEKIEPFYYISLEKYEKGYRMAYLYTIGGELQHLIQYIGETAIDVTYDMVCIILENKLKRNE